MFSSYTIQTKCGQYWHIDWGSVLLYRCVYDVVQLLALEISATISAIYLYKYICSRYIPEQAFFSFLIFA